MEAEIRKKVETTVIEILKKADLREMTEFKLRAAVSAELGISLSTVDCKMLIRDLVESFLLTDVQETVEDEHVEFPEGARPSIRGNSITKANDALMKKKTPELSDGQFLLIQNLSCGNDEQLSKERGINLTLPQPISIRNNVPTVIAEMETEFRSQPVEEVMKDSRSSMAGIIPGSAPIEINRFDGNNYHSWAQQVELFLKQINVFSALTDPRPVMNLSEDSSYGESASIRAAEAKWINDDYICRHNILSFLSDNLFYKYSQRTTNAKELWEQLKFVYQHEEFGSQAQQVKNYIEFQIASDKPVLEQVQELNQLADAVKAAGISIDEDFHVCAIISKLPPSWWDFSLKLMHVENPSFQLLMNQIKLEDELQYGYKCRRLQNFEEFQPYEKVELRGSDATNPRMYRKRLQGEVNGKPVICFNCGKKGHISRYCWSKKTGKEMKI